MAEAMEGIMGLPQNVDPMAGNPAADLAPVMQSYAKNNPREFNQNLMEGLSEADPQLAMSIRQELQALQLTARDLEDLRAMIQRIMDNPADYAAIRAEMIQSGMVEADDLPEQFDPMFFQTFMMVLEQIQPAPEQMAQGGLASLGRFGDTELAHVNPQEMAVLRAMGGSGSINPRTGLREFGFFSKIFKGIKKAVKSVLKSPIGQLVATIGLGVMIGPGVTSFLGGSLGATGAFAVTSGLSSTLVGLASGQSFGDALKGGVLSGVTAFAGGKIFGTPEMFEYQAPGTPATPPPSGAPDMTALKPGVDATGAAIPDAAAGVPGQTIAQPNVAPMESLGTPTGTLMDKDLGFLSGTERLNMPTAPAQVPTVGATPSVPAGATPSVPGTAPQVAPGAAAPTNAQWAQAAKNTPGMVKPTVGNTLSRAWDQTLSGDVMDAGSTLYDNLLSPSKNVFTGTEWDAAVASNAQDIYTKSTGLPFTAQTPTTDPTGWKLAIEASRKAAEPGIMGTLSSYAPLAIAGTGVAALGGAFDEGEPPEIPDWAKGPTGFELLAQQPEKYGLSWGGARTAGYGGGYGLPRYAAEGGIMNAFPRKNGHITGPGTGTSDDVPAMLSDGEFVMTAQAVRNMGNGSRRAGAKKMHALMKALETRMA